MDEIMRRAVERSLITMKDNLGERLTIDDIARAAMFSKFHFTRMFQRATGVTPGRFLSAMRLAEAKRLLLTTEGTVSDIGHQVGYLSVGTFSSRFSMSVGVSPRTYRKLRGRIPPLPDSRAEGPGYSLVGNVSVPAGVEFGTVFVGLFPGRITEGIPARHAFLDRPGQYTLPAVPAGSWHLFAHAFGRHPGGEPGPWPFMGHSGPVTTRGGVTARIAEIRLRPRGAFDPPVLLALPDLRRVVEQPQPIAS